MRIRATVRVGSGGAPPRRVTIEVPADVASDELGADRVVARLADTLGVAGDALCVSGRLVDGATPLGRPPLVDGVSLRVVQRASWAAPRTSGAVAALELAVVGGPDSGRAHPLTAGAHTVGRAADLSIADPALSRLHLRLDVGPDGVTAADLGSENGTLVEGAPLPSSGITIGLGTVLKAGRTTLVLRPSHGQPVTVVPRGDGTLLVSRALRPEPDLPEVRIEVPRPPEAPTRRRIPWPAALVPIPVAAVLAWVLGPHLLLIAVMSPLMLLGTHLSERLGSRREYAVAARAHQAAVEDCSSRREAALAAERRWREHTFPDPAAVARVATAPGILLWSRPGGAGLRLRIGSGRARSGVTWAEAPSVDHLVLEDAPVTMDLAQVGALAVAGPLRGRVADALIGQLVVLHSPRDLVLLTDRPAWELAPHVRVASASELVRDAAAVLRSRSRATAGAGSGEGTEPTVALVIDASGLPTEELDLLTSVIHEGGRGRVHVILSGGAPSAVATRLRTTPTAASVLSGPGGESVDVIADGVGSGWVATVAAALAPLRDTTDPGDDLPTHVCLADLVDVPGAPLPATDRIAAAWDSADDGAWAMLGVTSVGPCRLDLAASGPHALLGGTTGSGKSELLRTLVLSLAVEHPPEDMALVLIDYKGGSAFATLSTLPHVVGLVTDLDTGLTARALTSLRAEVHRREALFARCGAADIAGYRRESRRVGADLPHLARLVIVVDEFRALADELPEFVTGLVRLAAVGRSLGIHLVLATQRPSGVVTADMRANLGLRIALRVRDRTDSQDIVESDAAALIPRERPGRALLRCGAEPMTELQCATVESGDSAAGLSMAVAWSDGTTTRRLYPLERSGTRPDLVDAVRLAGRRSGRRPAPSPWLPPLPDRVEWHAALPRAAWALHDDTVHQRQEALQADPVSMQHTAIVGAIGSGRTTAALALAAAVLAAAGADTHAYAIADPSGAMASLGAAPHCGGVVDRTDPAQVAHLGDLLAEQVRARRTGSRWGLLLVVIDGWDVLAEACDPLDHGALTDRLLALLREGHAVGVRAIVTGDRSVLTGRVARICSDRLLLRPADPADLALAGLVGAPPVTRWPAGRAVRVRDRGELQVLLRTPDPQTVAPTTAPRAVRTLPTRLTLEELPPAPSGEIAVGMSSAGTAPVSVGAPGRRRVLVLGSAGAGRTEALATVAAGAVAAGRRVCVVSETHAPLLQRLHDRGVGVEQVGWSDPAALVALRRSHADLVVVADDVDRHLDSSLVPVLIEVTELAERDSGLVAVAGEGSTLAMRARGVGSVVARGRVGLVLGTPTPLDGDLLGVRLPRVRDVRPGRGWWVVDRRAIPAQLATGVGLSGSEAGSSRYGAGHSRYGADRPLHPTTTPTRPTTPSARPVTT